MTIQYIFDTIEKHKNCIKCNLCESRKAKGEFVNFGSGMVDSKGLIIIPKPRFAAGRPVGPYSMDSEEVDVLKSLWKATKLNSDDWYITSAIGCRTDEITDDHIRNCRDRLGDIVSSIGPNVVVCFGRTSLRAFAGDSEDTRSATRGVFLPGNHGHYRIYLTYDLTQYVEGKHNNVQGWDQVGREIMEDWQNIKKLMDD